MEQEDKELLLKDLAARLPYGVKLQTPKGIGHLGTIKLTIFGHEIGVNIKATEREYFSLEECKPYLRPLSSMTEEERKEMEAAIKKDCPSPYGEIKDSGVDNLLLASVKGAINLIDWLNTHHFDFRNLIEKGLAIKAPKDMYKAED